MTFLFVLIAIIILGLLVAKLIIPEKNEKEYSDFEQPQWLSKLSQKILLLGILLSVILAVLFNALTYFKSGHKYFVVSPFGNEYTIETPGYKIIMPFSTVTEWQKVYDIGTVPLNDEGEYMQDVSDIEGVIPNSIGVRFVDQVTADVAISARFELPSGEAFKKLAISFRTPGNLVQNTLVPTVREQTMNVSQMFRAENYVTGAAQDFRATLESALTDGAFVISRTEVVDTIYEEISVPDDIKSTTREIKDVQTRTEVEKVLGPNGQPLRQYHDINKYNIKVAQVIIDAVNMENKFKKKLEQQRDISAEKSIEAQKIETAKIAQQRIVAEGERDKAAERVKQEKAQVSKLIAIETQVKEEESKRQLAQIALERSKLESAKRKVDADAKAYELARADGLSEEQKYLIDAQVRRDSAVAAALAGPNGIRLPTTTIVGNGNGNSQGDITTLLLLKMLDNDKIK